MGKWKERVLLALFFLATAGIWLVWPAVRGNLDTTNYEKREMSPFPALNRGFPAAFESFLDDRMPFRNQLIYANSLMDLKLFGTDTTGKVIVGKDGWLFLRDSSDGSSLADYKGENLYSEAELAEFAQNVQTAKEYFASQGAEFVIYIAPDKERMYPEYLPDCYGAPAETFIAGQVADYLRSHTGVKVIWGMDDLAEAKQFFGGNTLLYFPADTHWNHLGAYIGAHTLLRELGIEIPAAGGEAGRAAEESAAGAGSPAAEPLHLEPYLNEPGDLAMLIHLADVFGIQEDIRVTGYDTHGMTEEMWDFATAFRYRTETGDPRKLMVIRDSFGTAWSDVLGSQFRESVMFHRDYYRPEMFSEEQPDIVVYECVERQVPALRDYEF